MLASFHARLLPLVDAENSAQNVNAPDARLNHVRPQSRSPTFVCIALAQLFPSPAPHQGGSPMPRTQESAGSTTRPSTAETTVLTERAVMWNAKRVSDALTWSGGHTVNGRDFVCVDVELSASRACPDRRTVGPA
jgi:hypothetical protein